MIPQDPPGYSIRRTREGRYELVRLADQTVVGEFDTREEAVAAAD